MRFFRIPGFTGIEAHRDDADRGSLRVVEGCLPFGTGGLRSGPVWEKIGRVDHYGHDDRNHVSAGDDGKGNSIIFVSRNCEVHDMVMFSEENTEFESLNATYDVAAPVEGMFSRDDATVSSIGNRLYAIGDGSQEAMYVGKGPVGSGAEVYPDETLYSQEWSRFPNCQYYARGPKATIFAAGNPDKPLTVYISEPAGLTSSFKDSPYSTEGASDLYNPGRLSTVDILGSDASKITALSTRGDQVVVHTDKGAFLLYAPASDQASTGYRVEQAPATNFSSAASHKVVSGEGGTQTFWVGHDGQVYKDEAASRGSAELKSNADQDQANWKSKGAWEHELPTDLSNSFSVFSGQTGDYLFFVESDEAKNFDFKDQIVALPVTSSGSGSGSGSELGASVLEEFHFECVHSDCAWGQHPLNPGYGEEGEDGSIVGKSQYGGEGYGYCFDRETRIETEEEGVIFPGKLVECGDFDLDARQTIQFECCKKMPGPADPDNPYHYTTCAECSAKAAACKYSGCCCSDVNLDSSLYQSWPSGCEDLFGFPCHDPELRQLLLDIGAPEDFADLIIEGAPCCFIPHLEPEERWTIAADRAFETNGCSCVKTKDPGGFESYSDCIATLVASGDCTFDYDGCGPCDKKANGKYFSMDSCTKAIGKDPNCKSYNVANCSCAEAEDGAFSTLEDCEAALNSDSAYENCWTTYKDDGCYCVKASDGAHSSEEECISYVKKNKLSCYGYNLEGCDCVEALDGVYSDITACQDIARSKTECQGYNLEGCNCVVDTSGDPQYTLLRQCESAVNQFPNCNTWDIVDCKCGRNDTGAGAYPSESACLEDLNSSSECKNYKIENCQCIESADGSILGSSACQEALAGLSECKSYTLDSNCDCIEDPNGSYISLSACQAAQSSCKNFSVQDCGCVADPAGTFKTIEECNTAVKSDSEYQDCWGYNAYSELCACTQEANGTFDALETCEDFLLTLDECKRYDIEGCDCTLALGGYFQSETICKETAKLEPKCNAYNIVDCACVRDDSGNAPYSSRIECEAALSTKDECNSWNLVLADPANGQQLCACVRDPQGTGTFEKESDCLIALNNVSSCDKYTINGCECKLDSRGWIAGAEACEAARKNISDCKQYEITADCKCEEAEDGPYLGLGTCEKEREESCARFDITECVCTENPESGTISGLTNCKNELNKEPYLTDCGGWFKAGCNCEHSFESWEFDTIQGCQAAVEADSWCGPTPWALPLPDTNPGMVTDPETGKKILNPDGSSVNGLDSLECHCTQNALTGTFSSKKECQDKLLEIRGKDELADCFGCEGTYVTEKGYGGEYVKKIDCCCSYCDTFAPDPVCNTGCRQPEQEIPIYFCHRDGGARFDCSMFNTDYCRYCRSEFDSITEQSDSNDEDTYVRDCDPEPNPLTGKSDCDECPQPTYYIRPFGEGGCECVEGASLNPEDALYESYDACLLGMEETCKMYSSTGITGDCSCEKTFEGSTYEMPAFETEGACLGYLAENQPECVWYSISDSCECVQDSATGVYLGINNCEAALETLPGCEDHYVNELCECVISEPVGNTDPPWRGLVECQNAVRNGYVEGCATYDLLPDCECIKREDGSGQYTGLTACEAARDASEDCKAHWISEDCTSCTRTNPLDGSTEFANKAACEDAIANNQLPERCVTYYWADENCESCTTTDPGDGSPKFTNQFDCLDALESGTIARCCSTDLQYVKDDREQACFEAGSSTPNASQCDCIAAGYDIFNL